MQTDSSGNKATNKRKNPSAPPTIAHFYPNATKYLQTLKKCSYKSRLKYFIWFTQLEAEVQVMSKQTALIQRFVSLSEPNFSLPEQKAKLKSILLLFLRLKLSSCRTFFPSVCPDEISKPEVTVALDLQGESSLSQHNTQFLN